ncbi:S phase cyclin A-associated protein in the endoplasmic reticulum-like protein [Cricetulus griseus]|nr:S phase cyclin A-associated protein in the endoplasmic reticulum-like protein [Cricetulus griseus]
MKQVWHNKQRKTKRSLRSVHALTDNERSGAAPHGDAGISSTTTEDTEYMDDDTTDDDLDTDDLDEFDSENDTDSDSIFSNVYDGSSGADDTEDSNSKTDMSSDSPETKQYVGDMAPDTVVVDENSVSQLTPETVVNCEDCVMGVDDDNDAENDLSSQTQLKNKDSLTYSTEEDQKKTPPEEEKPSPVAASFQRSNSHDKVRRIVAEEGRTARNLIAWSVPLESKDEDGKHKCQTGGKSKRTIQSTHKISKQEVLMMLDYYVRDFKALIDWIQLQEKLEKTDAQSRPTSLAWEVKKMSPGRHVIPSPSTDRMNVTSTARRSLNFGSLPGTVTAPCLAPTGVSWADKVKAHHTGSATSDVTPAQPCAPTTVQKNSRKNGNIDKLNVVMSNASQPERKDAEGWETVQRGRPVRPRSTVVMPKVSLVTETLRSKDDSDKENVCLLPGERTQKGDLVDNRPSVAESLSKDSFHPSDHPLAERTQFTVSILDDVKNSGGSQDSSVHTSEIPAVHSDAVCLAVTQQATSALPTDKDRVLAEKAGIVNETDPSDISNVSAADLSMAEVLAKKEELADRLEKANEEAIASAIAEEEQLTREIEAEENNDINIETDNDSDFSASMGSGSLSFCGMSMDWSDVLADYEARESWRQNTSWGDIVEEEPARLPGHGIHMHEKLSSPSRKRTIAESKKKYEEKHMKAQQLREKLREEKTLKLQKLLEREKDVRKWKEELLDQRRRMMEEKLLHAEFKREVQLQAIVKKAQEEEAKVNEIAFINTLEAQNKRHDVLSKLKEYEQRLNELQEERQRRQEEKQARDEAVQERKRALEAERQARVEELLMKRKEQEARIEQQRQEKEKAREDAARERARYLICYLGFCLDEPFAIEKIRF